MRLRNKAWKRLSMLKNFGDGTRKENGTLQGWISLGWISLELISVEIPGRLSRQPKCFNPSYWWEGDACFSNEIQKRSRLAISRWKMRSHLITLSSQFHSSVIYRILDTSASIDSLYLLLTACVPWTSHFISFRRQVALLRLQRLMPHQTPMKWRKCLRV